FELLPYSLSIYLSAAAVVYLLIGFLLSRAFISPFFDKIARHPVLRGPAVGFGVGVMVYLVAMVVHVTFNKDLDFRYLLLDITWQGVEEALGGLVVGIVYLVVFENVFHPVPEENDHEDQ
ncbi:MAG TPA: hypothetical protein VFU15_03825, partial [Bacteroidia bacterium]|nr:hypothetical protein [Bacteroidia bacterium]